MIAGTSADHQLWAQVRPVLEKSFRVIVFDNRDSGSRSLASQAYGIADLVADTVAVLKAAGSVRAHVLGHSLGGAIAQELALVHPEMVASLTLANSWARRDTYVTSVIELARDLAAAIADDALHLRAVYFLGLGQETLQALPLSALVGQVMAAGPVQPQQALVRQWQLDMEIDTYDRLPQITAPTHVIWSKANKIFMAQQPRELIEQIPNTTETIIDHAGHAPMIENPQGFTDAVIRFLQAQPT